MIRLAWKLVQVAVLGHAVVAQHATPSILAEVDTLIPFMRRLEEALTEPRCVLVCCAAARARHVSKAVHLLAQLYFVELTAMHAVHGGRTEARASWPENLNIDVVWVGNI